MRGPRKRNEDDGNDYDVNSGFAAEGWSSRCASRPSGATVRMAKRAAAHNAPLQE